MNKREFNWAILGTGVVANKMANALKKAGKSIYAVGNRTHSKAVDFAEKQRCISRGDDNLPHAFI